jgi:hypothetical protein
MKFRVTLIPSDRLCDSYNDLTARNGHYMHADTLMECIRKAVDAFPKEKVTIQCWNFGPHHARVLWDDRQGQWMWSGDVLGDISKMCESVDPDWLAHLPAGHPCNYRARLEKIHAELNNIVMDLGMLKIAQAYERSQRHMEGRDLIGEAFVEVK